MRMKQMQLVLVVFGLSSCLAYTGQIEDRMRETNPGWHIISETFSNAPFWLMPTNVPFRLSPLKNGQWVWTTNVDAIWKGEIEIDYDPVKEGQVRSQRLQRLDEMDPPGIAHVLEYNMRGRNEKHVWDTNMPENWWGIWAEDTNTGWRTNLRFYGTNTTNVEIMIYVGSIVTNSGAGLLPSPDGKYARLQLVDTNGKSVPPARGAAKKLYEMIYPLPTEPIKKEPGYREIVNRHQPAGNDASVERDYPNTLSDLEYPRWLNYSVERSGWFVKFAGFVSNGPPCQIGYVLFNDLFAIKAEGDYTLTVQPVLYRMHCEGGTFQGYLDRVDLPSVTTKVHLVSNQR